jgi:hypothetical protein
MNRTCTQCSADFRITDDDLAFYDKSAPVIAGKKYPYPPPVLCSTCRLQRRLAHINESKLYRRTSAKSGKEIVSIFSPDKPFVVYEPKEWWGDDWDAMDHGKPVDLKSSLTGQFQGLFKKVPLQALYVDSNENSDYVNYSGWDKNCYLCFCTDYSQDCQYCHSTYYAKNVVDCLAALSCELCYECVSCKGCYSLAFAQNCMNCSDGAFLFDCLGCKNCFGCTGLRQKEYCFFNEQLTKEEYAKRVAAVGCSSASTVTHMREKLSALALRLPRRCYSGQQNENITGNVLLNCRNVRECFDSTDLEDCKYCNSMRGAKDCYDVSHWGHPGELCYECMGIGEGVMQLSSCSCCWNGCSNLHFCFSCLSCQDCFLSVGLQKKCYCILNKQYTKDEYEALVPKIIERMIADGEWGQFFPVAQSPFGYNETVAQEYFPLTKQEVLKRGWKWCNYEAPPPAVEKVIKAGDLPDSVTDVPDDVLNWAMTCAATGKLFKINKQELEFYRRMKLPLPRLHPEERHKRRMALRNPRRLWERTCAKCSDPIVTSYAPDRPEVVVCERCYLETVY